MNDYLLWLPCTCQRSVTVDVIVVTAADVGAVPANGLGFSTMPV